MTLSYSEQENLIKKALSDIDDDVFRSTAAAARHYGVKARRLQLRLKGYAFRSTRISTHIRLTVTQE